MVSRSRSSWVWPLGPDLAARGMDLDAHVRAADFDRWASSRLVQDDDRRSDLIALYAFEAELMAIPTRVSQPTLAEMRYAWWSEQMDGVFTGEPRKGHPVLERLSQCVRARGLDREVLDGLIEAHIGRVHGDPHDLEAFYIAPMAQAVRILGAQVDEGSAYFAGRLWGLIQTGQADAARTIRPEANKGLADLPVVAFPAVAHAALGDPAAPEALKRLRLAWAALRGRV